MSALEILARPFGSVADLVRFHAGDRPRAAALLHGERRVTYAQLDALMDRVVAALARDGVRAGESIALCAANSIEYSVLFLGALRAGVVSALIPPSAPADSIAKMEADAGAKLVFGEAKLEPHAFEAWLTPAGSKPPPAAITPQMAFNIIYSSGTTGTPKGIVQPFAMRWAHVQRGPLYGYGADSVTLVSTPLYSNTTLVAFFPTFALGGTVVLMGKFDAASYLELAQRHRVTHTMLVPVQYQRIMALPDFGRYDLSSFRMKFSTSAPFAAALKRDVLARWPGGLIEYYGMTEGGVTCVLVAHEHPEKLHTVGVPGVGVDVVLLDEALQPVAPGEVGEVAGHSPAAMMTGYHNRPEATREAEWFDAAGKRYIRTGDVGRFDADGFLVLLDRRKDLVISGGFNVYPSDLEAVLREHPDVVEAAVVGVPSLRWGETPVACVVLRPGAAADEGELLRWANARLGKVQRLAGVRALDALPRSAIGKVLKRELRERFAADFRD
jgi:long-chain acyl-CoA synthetase